MDGPCVVYRERTDIDLRTNIDFDFVMRAIRTVQTISPDAVSKGIGRFLRDGCAAERAGAGVDREF